MPGARLRSASHTRVGVPVGWKGLAAGTAVPFTRGLCHRARPRVAPGAERHASTRVREGTRGSQHLARRPSTPAHRPASPACRSPAAPAVSAWASLPTWLRQRGPGGRGPGAAGQSRLGLRRSPGGGAGGTDGFASLSSLPSSASPLLAPSTLSPLRGSKGPSVAPGTQVTRHTASVTHGALSPARVPRGLWASIWAEGHPSSQPASG